MTPELLFQVFVVAIRRTLAREPGSQAVASHVTQAFARLGIERGERAVQKGVRLVSGVLGRIEWRDGAFARDLDLVRALLYDLVRARRMDEAEFGALVAAGERRVRRLRRTRQGRRMWWWDRRSDRPGPVGGGGGLRTIAGCTLKALACYDTRGARALPDDPKPECALAIIDNAFAIAVRERFGERPDPEHIVLLAESVSRLAQTTPIAVSDVESLVLAEFTDSAAEPEKAAEIKVATFVKIVDDLCLYDHEIDDMIIMAEGIAEEDGCELSLLDKG